MDMITTFRKSALGAEAIATRQHGLGPKLRSMLILIDGKRSTADVLQLTALLGDAKQLLAELASGGFIEAASPQSTPAGPAPRIPDPVAPAALSLPEARRLVVRKFTDLLGPMADDMCIRIESTRTAADLDAAVARAEAMVRNMRGASAAQAFADAVSRRHG